MSTPFFSILMLTFNSSWDKTRQTLYSILTQKNIDFELIIADDGSKENHFEKIRQFFKSFEFSNYILVENNQNLGTVKNFQSGFVHCHGEYIKTMAPGDFLYDEDTLAHCYEKIKEKYAAIYFGRMIYYSYVNSTLNLYSEKWNPRDLGPYLNHDNKAIKRNYLQHRDFIVGASAFYKTTILQKYLEDFTSLVKFAEDLIIAYMIANNEKIELIDFIDNKPIIWYESATGVSTSGNSKWQEKLREDCRNMFCFLKEKKIIPKWIYYSHFCNNKIIRMFIKLIHEPNIIAVFLKNGTEIKTNQGKAPYYDKLILKQIIGK